METNILESFEALFGANKRIYWLYILSSVLIALLYLSANHKERKINLSKKLWLHKSAVLDYNYFIVSFFIKTLLIVPLIISVNEISIFVYETLLELYGFTKIGFFTYFEVMILFTFTLFVVSDFTRYLLHRLLHLVPFLWEFHKVHHSAKVLTPITFYRVHPLENLLFGFRYALSIGLVSGLFIYLFGAMITIYDIVGVNALLFIFSLMGSNLRHSHIKLSYPTVVEKILISPFAHQLHHSTKFYNKNFGGYLSIWDRLFHTFQDSNEVKKSEQTIKFGVKTQDYQTIRDLLFRPFQNILGENYAK